MRIYTDNGAQLLEQEIQRLETQCQNCLGVETNISGFTLLGMQGEAQRTLAQKINLQASVAKAHMAFYQSLLLADRNNLALVKALPTTSSGVLDTDEAQERIESARRERTRLENLQRQTVSQNTGSAKNGSWNYNSTPPITVNTPLITFNNLIGAQDAIIYKNEQIIEKANRYIREATALYAGIDLSLINASGNSVASFLSGKGYGDTSWITKASAAVSYNTKELEKRDNWLYNFFGGKLKDEYSKDSSEMMVAGEILGIPISFRWSRDGNGWSYEIKPYGEEAGVGAKGEEEAHLGKDDIELIIGKHTYSVGAEYGKVETTAAFGAKLMNSKGELDPSVIAKLGGSATLLTFNYDERKKYADTTWALIDDTEYQVAVTDTQEERTGANVNVLTASADAKLELSKEGLRTKAGAEAYLVTGEVSKGFDLFGIHIDGTLEGKAWGAGVEAGVDVDDDGLVLDLGAGLLLGLEGKVKVDWSDAVAGYRESVDRLDEWWVDGR